MNLKQCQEANLSDIEAVRIAATRLDMQPLNTEVVGRIAQFGLSALVECTIAAQDSALPSALRARFCSEVANGIAALQGARYALPIDQAVAA
jgi:hypothetical protein